MEDPRVLSSKAQVDEVLALDYSKILVEEKYHIVSYSQSRLIDVKLLIDMKQIIKQKRLIL